MIASLLGSLFHGTRWCTGLFVPSSFSGEKGDSQDGPHQLHLENPLFLLLVEIIDAVGLVELVVCLHQPLLDGYCKAESGFCRPVVMLDLTACIPGKFEFDRILTGVLQ